ncbi:hypothetical protein H9649_00400 [Sporosarcina sp. Sa2YVA2]|uniref:Uncharacterized protein n=1 Tax=Sporosarcina quadrami TaxID=2762234 RepID=A0ABR8U4Q4_9BACL|nr:hypothetical protein [Sporosarcina quadrami]MBD7983022.1 hypothetical protein [Sporosarcina quadrami]
MIKNDKGYALLIVLFLIVFITIISAVFMRISITNAKQENEVDQNHLVVATAEMGVDYFKTIYMNAFFEKKEEMYKKISTAKENKYEEAREEVINVMRNDFIKALGKSEKEREVNSYLFQGSNERVTVGKNKGELIIEGKVTGFNNSKSKESSIDYTFTFFIPPYIPEDKKKPGQSNTIIFEKTFPPTGNYLCNNKLSKNSGKKCYFASDIIEADDVDLKKGTSILIKGNADVDELEMKNDSYLKVDKSLTIRDDFDLNKSHVYVGESMTSHDEIDLKNDSSLYVKGKVDAYDGVKMIKSNFYVGGDLNVDDELELKNKSNLFVVGNLTVKDDFEIKSNSKVCVGGNLTAKDDVDINGELYMIRDSHVEFSDEPSKVKYVKWVNSFEELLTVCSSEGNSVIWGLKEIDTRY